MYPREAWHHGIVDATLRLWGKSFRKFRTNVKVSFSKSDLLEFAGSCWESNGTIFSVSEMTVSTETIQCVSSSNLRLFWKECEQIVLVQCFVYKND